MHACPRDGAPLVRQRTRGLEVWHCGTCAGMWLPPPVVTEAIGHRPRIAPEQHGFLATRLRCPTDHARLLAIHTHDVQVDLCADCGGAWMDHGELEYVLAARRGARTRGGGATLDIVDGLAAGADAETAVEASLDIGELAAESLGAVLQFLGDALSGL